MASLTPTSMFVEEISDLNLSPETLFISVNQSPFRWQYVKCYIANDASIYPQIFEENTDFQSWIELLEFADT